MIKRFRTLFVLGSTLCLSPALFAQKWEVGVGAGGGFFTSHTVRNSTLSGDATLTNCIAASAWLGNNSSRLLGGELRYDYEKPDLRLSSGGSSPTFGAETHAFHYDFLFHFTPKEARVRPFVSAGGGVKLYRGTGKETAFQPLSSLALLTKTTDTKGLISAGAGVKLELTRALQLRLEIRDALTPFPNKVITPAQGAKLDGWLQDFVVMLGLSIAF